MDLKSLKDSIEEFDLQSVEGQLIKIQEGLNSAPGGDTGDSEGDSAYKLLHLLAASVEGRRLLLKNNIPQTLCQVILEESKGFDQALQLLETLLLHNGKSCWYKTTNCLNAVIAKYTSKLSLTSLESERRQHLSLIEKIVSPTSGLSDVACWSKGAVGSEEPCPKYGTTGTAGCPKPFEDAAEKPTWGKDLQTFVHQVISLSSHASEDDKQLTLQMTGGILALLAHFENTDTFLLKSLDDESVDGQFLILLSTVTCQHLSDVLNAHDLQLVNEKACLVKAYYSIIACVLMSVLNSAKVQQSTDIMQQVLPSLAVAVHDVTSFVTYLASHPKEQFEESLVAETVILLSVGCLVDMSSFQERIVAVLPFMLGLGREYFVRTKVYNDKAQSTEATDIDDKPIDVVGCLLVLLSFLVPDQRCCQILVDCQFFPILLDYLTLLNETRISRIDARREIQMVAHIIFASSACAAHNVRTYCDVQKFLTFIINSTPQLLSEETTPNFLKDVFVLAGITIMGDFTKVDPGTPEELAPFFEGVVQFYSKPENQADDLCEGFLMDDTMKFLDYNEQQASVLSALGWSRRLGLFCNIASRYPWLDSIIIKFNWVKSLLKQAEEIQAEDSQTNTDRITAECTEGVLAQFCHIFPVIKQFVIDNNGLQLAEKKNLLNLKVALTGESQEPAPDANTDGVQAHALTDPQQVASLVRGNMGSLVGAFIQFMEQMARSDDSSQQNACGTDASENAADKSPEID